MLPSTRISDTSPPTSSEHIRVPGAVHEKKTALNPSLPAVPEFTARDPTRPYSGGKPDISARRPGCNDPLNACTQTLDRDITRHRSNTDPFPRQTAICEISANRPTATLSPSINSRGAHPTEACDSLSIELLSRPANQPASVSTSDLKNAGPDRATMPEHGPDLVGA